ncbi:hypothetical protein FRB90_002906 [Tulasnella sp. 427]|nr:hypothetical protein FRB90_002906 [Tulasnella sp. 427]
MSGLDSSGFLSGGQELDDNIPRFAITFTTATSQEWRGEVQLDKDEEPVVKITSRRRDRKGATELTADLAKMESLTKAAMKSVQDVLKVEFIEDDSQEGDGVKPTKSKKRPPAYFQRVRMGAIGHEMGTVPMPAGQTNEKTLIDDKLRLTEPYRGVYVCDLSVFPGLPEANPSLTLAALAIRLSRTLLPRFDLDKPKPDELKVVNHSGDTIEVWASNRAKVKDHGQHQNVKLRPGEHKSWTRKKDVFEAVFVFRRNTKKYDALLFRGVDFSPEQQYALTKAFDPTSESYGHGNNKTGETKKSILHPDLKTIPRQPQVQLIGNGTVYDHEGLAEAKLKHPHHRTFHKTVIPQEDDLTHTRFYRWHIDAALYDLAPPKVTTLYALNVPRGEPQTLRYDDGTNDELKVPLGTTAFVSGATMFDILPKDLKSLAVRSKVKYAPHPYVWMAPAHAMSTGLGIETEGLELPLEELPPWEEEKVKAYPICWKNPVTGNLHFQVHPCGVQELIVDPLPAGADREGALYPDGAHLKDLKEVRDIIYKMQRPAIAPELVYPHDWDEKDLVLFHNRGILHSVVGAFAQDQVRAFHQCNLAASTDPEGPSAEDVAKYA